MEGNGHDLILGIGIISAFAWGTDENHEKSQIIDGPAEIRNRYLTNNS
jgi:hypothetical protein